jgi:hypothetical protein|tara:strand:- start:546 stop:1010 length:465 start_codon:yes stop_codon:yes gene_type:complete
MAKVSTKQGKSGMRGTPTVDRVQDVDLFIEEYKNPDGTRVRTGHAKIAHEINNALGRQAKELKVSKSRLIRNILESFVKYQDESKAIGTNRFFDARVSIEGWIAERADLNALLMEMRAKDIIVNDESQSPEVKMLSMQMVVLAKMINLTHKNLL